MTAAISLVIPNYNGAHLLPTCLDAVGRQTRPANEVIVVDDASTDASLALLRDRYPSVHVLALNRNGGFAQAANAGIAASIGDIVVLLNNDTEAEPGWLEALCRPLLERPEVGWCASKLLLFDRRDVLHSAGDGFGRDGLPRNRGVWAADNGEFDRQELVFGACAGAAAYRRGLLEELGGFDESLGAYCEDVDLNWRAQLQGYRCLYVPEARVYHMVSATGGGPRASFLCGRNTILVLAKDVPAALLRRHWRRMLRAQLRLAAECLHHWREPAARARLRGLAAGVLRAPSYCRRRRETVALRRVSDDYLESLLCS
jgi:GT2 family glycosyltransferase